MICTSNHFPISQSPKSCLAKWARVFTEIGKLGNGLGELDLPIIRGRVYKHGLGAPIHFPMLSPYPFINARCVYKHRYGALIVAQNVINNVNANGGPD